MPKIQYIEKNFRTSSLELIDSVNTIISVYDEQGYSLTLRQVYYQLVARDIIPNNMRSYKNLGNLINDARLAGLIDWYSIEDRTRNLKRLSSWDSPQDIIRASVSQYRKDWWEHQKFYVEVWVEKEALSNIVGKVSDELGVPYICCRGYMSQSEMWSASRRYKMYQRDGKEVIILHLGDHDPSGIDMSRDIQERLALFEVDLTMFHFERIALNMDQIEEFNPPPNPAKITDSRSKEYISKYGNDSWELDALEPKTIRDLISAHVNYYCNPNEVERVKSLVDRQKKVMEKVAENWQDIYKYYNV